MHPRIPLALATLLTLDACARAPAKAPDPPGDPYPEPDGHIVLEELLVQRRWLQHYGGAVHHRRGYAHEFAMLARESPPADSTVPVTAEPAARPAPEPEA